MLDLNFDNHRTSYATRGLQAWSLARLLLVTIDPAPCKLRMLD